jgi:hypothetical protein
MSIRQKLPLLGALAATPTLTASVEPAVGGDFARAPAAYVAPSSEQVALRAAFKARMLQIAPGDKLAIAGDRLGPDPALGRALAIFSDGSGRVSRSAAPRTNTDIPECHAAGSVKGKTSRCSKANASKCGSGAAGGAPRTNTDIPECHAPGSKACGGGKAGGAPRTNTDIPECRAPGAKNCGSSNGSRTPGTNEGTGCLTHH